MGLQAEELGGEGSNMGVANMNDEKARSQLSSAATTALDEPHHPSAAPAAPSQAAQQPLGAAPSSSTSVRVAVRVRPQTQKERSQRERDTVNTISHTRQACIGERSFTFDYVYDQNSTQRDIYEQSVRPLVESSLAGYNATVFAYGQTGSGKTYTMGSGSWNSLHEDELGMLPRALRQIFDEKSRRDMGPGFVLRASFLEIHNEELKDLLAAPPPGFNPTANRPRALAIREDPAGGIYIAGAEEREVSTLEDMLLLLEQGTARRATGSTDMNTHSSRSHAIFSVIIEQTVVHSVDNGDPEYLEAAGTGEEEYITSKFHFVDLAGSERIKKTRAEGERLKEGININSGLLALGNVISALGDETRSRNAHVPYRDSKLTRMLQDSLGGNSRTLMIACVSPVESNSEESVNTLKYANRARNIKNTPIINRDPNSHLVAQLRKEIAFLRSLLKEHGIVPRGGSTTSCSSPDHDRAPIAAYLYSEVDMQKEVIGQVADPLLEEEVQSLELQLVEHKKLVDEFKLGMAEIYTSTAKLQHEVTGLKSSLGTSAQEMSVANSFSEIERLIGNVQDMEERCRFKSIMKLLPAGASRPSTSTTGTDEQPQPPLPGADQAVIVPALNLKAVSEASASQPEEGPPTERSDVDWAEDESFLGNNNRLQGQLQDMDAALVEKERLLQELVKNQREFDTMRNTYERKMEDMQSCIKAIELERDRVLSELSVLDRRASSSVQTRDEKEKWRERLRQLEDELKKLRKKVRDHERLLSFKEQGEQKISALSQEVDRLKTTRAQLHKKIARDAKGHREKQHELEKQIVSLRKADMASKRQIRDLETKLSSAARAEHVSRRRAQIAALKQKSARDEQLDTSVKRAEKVGDVVSWFRGLVQKGSGTKQAKEKIEEARSIRQKLEKEQESCFSRLDALQRAGSEEAAKQAMDLKDESEYLSAELEFRNIEEDKAKQQLAEAQKAAVEAKDMAAKLADTDIKKLIASMFQELVDGRDAVASKNSQLHEAEVLLVEARRNLEEAQISAQAKHKEYDTRVTQIQREYEAKLMFVFEQLEEANKRSGGSTPRLSEPLLPFTGGSGNRNGRELESINEPEHSSSFAAVKGAKRSKSPSGLLKEDSSDFSKGDPRLNGQRLSPTWQGAEPLGDGPNAPLAAVSPLPPNSSKLEPLDPSARSASGISRKASVETRKSANSRTVDVTAVQNIVIEKADRILASSRQNGGDLSAPVHRTPSSEEDETAAHNKTPSELFYVADVLGSKKSDGNRGKIDKRQKVDELRMKVNSVWEALQVPETHRARFKNMTASASSKPEQSLHAWEQEYAQQLKCVSASVEEARQRLEEGWKEIGAPEGERTKFLCRLEELSGPENELAALRLARSEVLLLDERVDATRQIRALLLKREDMLTKLCEGASQELQGPLGARGGELKAKAASPANSTHTQETLRKIVREYPKVVSTLKKYITRWEENEGRGFVHKNVRALDMLNNGDSDLLFRAMHHKLMSGSRGNNTDENASSSRGQSSDGAVTPRLEEKYAVETPEELSRDDSTRSDGSPDAGRQVNRSNSSSKVTANALRRSTTSQMALRFEALKQTYAQVRSRSSCLNQMPGRQEAVRKALEDKGLLQREALTPRGEGKRRDRDATSPTGKAASPENGRSSATNDNVEFSRMQNAGKHISHNPQTR